MEKLTGDQIKIPTIFQNQTKKYQMSDFDSTVTFSTFKYRLYWCIAPHLKGRWIKRYLYQINNLKATTLFSLFSFVLHWKINILAHYNLSYCTENNRLDNNLLRNTTFDGKISDQKLIEIFKKKKYFQSEVFSSKVVFHVGVVIREFVFRIIPIYLIAKKLWKTMKNIYHSTMTWGWQNRWVGKKLWVRMFGREHGMFWNYWLSTTLSSDWKDIYLTYMFVSSLLCFLGQTSILRRLAQSGWFMQGLALGQPSTWCGGAEMLGTRTDGTWFTADDSTHDIIRKLLH